MTKKMKKTLTPRQVAEQMLSELGDIDWCYRGGGGLCQLRLSASQVIKWCEAMDYPVPEGTIEHAAEANQE